MAQAKFTTTIKNELLLKLKHDAVEQGIPVNRILEDIAEQHYTDKESLETVPCHPGVYFFYDEGDTLLYIGKSIDVNNRLKTHFSPRCHLKQNDLARVKKIQIILTQTNEEAVDLEKDLILITQPELNTVYASASSSGKTKQATCHLPEELIRDIKIICVDKGITFQKAVFEALQDWKAKLE